MTGGVFKNLIAVCTDQSVKVTGGDPKGFLRGWGTVGCRLAEVDKGRRVAQSTRINALAENTEF
jgi:hypothetical protein